VTDYFVKKTLQLLFSRRGISWTAPTQEARTRAYCSVSLLEHESTSYATSLYIYTLRHIYRSSPSIARPSVASQSHRHHQVIHILYLRISCLIRQNLNHTSHDGDVHASLTGRSADSARSIGDLKFTYYSPPFVYSYSGVSYHLVVPFLPTHRNSTPPQRLSAPRHMPFQH
jgi:hypothetical protein